MRTKCLIQKEFIIFKFNSKFNWVCPLCASDNLLACSLGVCKFWIPCFLVQGLRSKSFMRPDQSSDRITQKLNELCNRRCVCYRSGRVLRKTVFGSLSNTFKISSYTRGHKTNTLLRVIWGSWIQKILNTWSSLKTHIFVQKKSE